MELTCALLLLVLVGIVQGNDNSRYLVESGEKSSGNDQEAYESFASPVYGTSGPKSGSYPPPPKSGYNVPTVPAGYSRYFAGLGSGYGLSPYSRYGVLPYSSPYYNYGGPYNALPYGYAPGLNSVLGYSSGLAYGNAGYGRDGYSAFGNGFPGYAGLGYRFGGLGYNSAYFRAPGVPAPLSSPYGGIPAPVPAGFPNGVVGLPPTYPGIPVAAGSAPVPLPSPAVAGRPPLTPTQGKDGSLRYAYSPVAPQRPPGY